MPSSLELHNLELEDCIPELDGPMGAAGYATMGLQDDVVVFCYQAEVLAVIDRENAVNCTRDALINSKIHVIASAARQSRAMESIG